ncbi:hypothetical protein HGRIS_006776 [Hohenbuehelia grisea]|uniref:Velvet domain-containing protein n=1 Tax=Hohenbuehelia grisea TaxID=104357 RepID=A0ABR3JA31_9AGAR
MTMSLSMSVPKLIPMPHPYREYELTVRQEPKQARMCGVGGKADRRPIDPPPIVQLRVIDPAAPSSSRRRTSSAASAPGSPTPSASGRNLDDTSGDSSYNSQISAGYAQSFLQNPYYFMFASLAKPDDDAELHWLKDGRTRCTTGSVVSSLYHLKDSEHNNEDAGFFVFPDLSVRTEGSYRLKLSLFEVVGNNVRHCKSIFSAPFYVYTAKKFPGMEESTPLSCSLADQGIKIRIRKDIRVRKRPMASLEHPLPPSHSSFDNERRHAESEYEDDERRGSNANDRDARKPDSRSGGNSTSGASAGNYREAKRPRLDTDHQAGSANTSGVPPPPVAGPESGHAGVGIGPGIVVGPSVHSVWPPVASIDPSIGSSTIIPPPPGAQVQNQPPQVVPLRPATGQETTSQSQTPSPPQTAQVVIPPAPSQQVTSSPPSASAEAPPAQSSQAQPAQQNMGAPQGQGQNHSNMGLAVGTPGAGANLGMATPTVGTPGQVYDPRVAYPYDQSHAGYPHPGTPGVGSAPGQYMPPPPYSGHPQYAQPMTPGYPQQHPQPMHGMPPHPHPHAHMQGQHAGMPMPPPPPAVSTPTHNMPPPPPPPHAQHPHHVPPGYQSYPPQAGWGHPPPAYPDPYQQGHMQHQPHPQHQQMHPPPPPPMHPSYMHPGHAPPMAPVRYDYQTGMYAPPPPHPYYYDQSQPQQPQHAAHGHSTPAPPQGQVQPQPQHPQQQQAYQGQPHPQPSPSPTVQSAAPAAAQAPPPQQNQAMAGGTPSTPGYGGDYAASMQRGGTTPPPPQGPPGQPPRPYAQPYYAPHPPPMPYGYGYPQHPPPPVQPGQETWGTPASGWGADYATAATGAPNPAGSVPPGPAMAPGAHGGAPVTPSNGGDRIQLAPLRDGSAHMSHGQGHRQPQHGGSSPVMPLTLPLGSPSPPHGSAAGANVSPGSSGSGGSQRGGYPVIQLRSSSRTGPYAREGERGLMSNERGSGRDRDAGGRDTDRKKNPLSIGSILEPTS